MQLSHTNMKNIVLLSILLLNTASKSQTTIEWDPNIKLKLEDFQSLQSEIKPELTTYSIFTGTNIDFNFRMTNGEFMFTKNFNSKVKTVFNTLAAVIIANDTVLAQQLVNYGQYSFDLTELYSRKFRKRMYEQKGAFSNVSFYLPIFEELHQELNTENARVLKLTDLGRNEDILKEEHLKVLKNIEELSNFCKTCKPPKKRK